MTEHAVATTDELLDGDRLIVELEGREVAVFNIDNEYYAYLNYCPHQGGPLCEGNIVGTIDASFDRDTLEYSWEWVKDDEVMVCPWHNWEFDLLSGESLSRKGTRVPSYPVKIEDENIIVEV